MNGCRADGTLTLRGFGAWGDALHELREQARIRLGGSYIGRAGDVSHAIRFPDPDALETTLPNGKAITWKRRR